MRSYPKQLLSGLATLAFTATAAPAAIVTTTYTVSLDTASLATDADDVPFAFAVQLNSGAAPGVYNSVTLDQFAFAAGGSAGDASTVSVMGHATGTLSTSVTLDTDVSGSFNYFQQDFAPGGTLTFRLMTTTNGVDPLAATPDELSVQLLDAAGQPVPTTDPDGTDSVLTLEYADPSPTVASFGGDTARLTTAGRSLAFAAPTVSAVPEPAALTTLIVVPLALLGRRRRPTLTMPRDAR